MPSKITVRFFQVVLPVGATVSFSDALEHVALFPVQQRRRDVEGTAFRLEQFQVAGQLITGQMTRIQDDNLPAAVTPEGLEELEAGELGHGSAFLYSKSLSVLAIQYDPRLVTPGRLGQYLSRFFEDARFQFLAIPGPSTWDSFNDGNITSFKVRVATQRNLGLNDVPLTQNIAELARVYDAPYVTVTLGVGHQRTHLSDAIKNTARALMGAEPVEMVRAKVQDNPEPIDLMEYMLHDKDTITVPADPAESYRVRAGVVSRSYLSKRHYIREFLAELGDD